MLLELTIDYFDSIYVVTESITEQKYTYEPIEILNSCSVNEVNIVTYKTNKRKRSVKYIDFSSLMAYSSAIQRAYGSTVATNSIGYSIGIGSCGVTTAKTYTL